MTEIPNISKVNSGTDHQGDPFAEAWFTNGARLRYRHGSRGIHEDVFAPSDPDSVMETAVVVQPTDGRLANRSRLAPRVCEVVHEESHPDATVEGCLVESLDVLADFESVEELQQDWPNLGEWITHE